MKRSASKAELSCGQEEPLDDAVDSIQAGLQLEPQGAQEQGNVGEGSVQAASGAALQSTHAGLGLESCSFQNVERGAIQDKSGSGLGSHSCQEQPSVEGVAIQLNRGACVQPTQADLELGSHSFQEQPNVEKRGGDAVEPTQQILQLQSHIYQEQRNVEEVAIQPKRRIAVQPTQAGLGLESYSSQEQPNEEGEGALVSPTQVALPNPSNLEVSSADELHDILQPLVEDHDHFEEASQSTTGQVEVSHQEEASIIVRQASLSDMNNLRIGQVDQGGGACINDRIAQQTPPSDMGSGQDDQEQEACSINDTTVQQSPPSDMNDLGSGQIEASRLEEEEAVINDRVVSQNPSMDMDNLRRDGWIELLDLEEPMDDEENIGIQARAGSQQTRDKPPQQGTAGRRMRLQVPLCDAEGLSEPNCAPIDSEPEAEFLPTALLHRARATMQEEGGTKGHYCAKALISRVSKFDHPAKSSNDTVMDFGSEDGFNGSSTRQNLKVGNFWFSYKQYKTISAAEDDSM